MKVECRRGHLMCGSCFYDLLADARLRNMFPTCPTCEADISMSKVFRNLTAEEVTSELPRECQYCSEKFVYKLLDRHEREECEKRPAHCRYSLIGCPWLGPWVAASEHEGKCLYVTKSIPEIMNALDELRNKSENENNMYTDALNLLHHKHVTFVELRFKPNRDDYSQLYFETSTFSAFGQEWVLDATVNDIEGDPDRSFQRFIMYQLSLKTEICSEMEISFSIMKSPHSSIRMTPRTYKHIFSQHNTASGYKDLPLVDSDECNRLLANCDFKIRFFMSARLI
uniref:TRAF-type domain-containing protein n=1 Tax=Glossina brevipalpis TaxID=37001 RepID=A0A1A9WSX5_9MUSC